MKRKLLSLLLVFVMLLSAVPALGITASARDSAYTLVLAADKGYQNTAGGTEVNLADKGITVTGDAQTGYTYTFNNVNFVTTAATAIQFNNDATVTLTGNNTVTGGNAASGDTYGILSDKSNLTFNGEGNLTLTAGIASDGCSYGLFSNKNVTFNNGGNIKITAGNVNKTSCGLMCYLVEMKRGSVEGVSGTSNSTSGYALCYGVSAKNSLHMEGGTLNCVAGNAATTNTYGARSVGLTVEAELAITGGTIQASSGTQIGKPLHSITTAVELGLEPDAKVVDTDTKTELEYDEDLCCYKDNETISLNVTITALNITNYTLVLAADKGYQNFVGSTEVDLAELGITVSGNAASGYNYTFNNVNFSTTAAAAVSFANDATVTLEGTNTIDNTGASYELTYGIRTTNKLTIQGEGSITVTAGKAPKGWCYGFYCNDALTINGGEISVAAGNATHGSRGVFAQSFTMKKGTAVFKSGNVVNAVSTAVCYGLSINNDGSFHMEGGNLTCVAGNAPAVATEYGLSMGINVPCSDFTVTGGTIIASSGNVEGNADKMSSAVYSASAPNAIAVTTGTDTELDFDAANFVYKNSNNEIVKNVTLTTANICQVGATNYSSVAKALKAIGKGAESQPAVGTIKLLADNKESITIGEYQDIILDLNGYTLANKDVTTIDNNGKLTVIDSSVNKTGKITSDGYGIFNGSSGDLTVTDIKINAVNDTASSRTIGIVNCGTCKVQGDQTEITATATDIAYALSNARTISVTGGKFTASGSGEYIAAIYISSENPDMVTISDDAEFILGASTATTKTALLSVVDYTISAGKFNGPIASYGTAKVTVTGGSFSEDPTAMVDTAKYDVTDNGAGVTYRYTVMQDIPARFAREKARVCAAFDELGTTYDGCFATRDIRKAKEAVNNYQYDESKTFEENVAALDAIFTKTAEKVVKRHNFIYGCPFMTLFARMVEWILDIFKITL